MSYIIMAVFLLRPNRLILHRADANAEQTQLWKVTHQCIINIMEGYAVLIIKNILSLSF